MHRHKHATFAALRTCNRLFDSLTRDSSLAAAITRALLAGQLFAALTWACMVTAACAMRPRKITSTRPDRAIVGDY